jgi:NAD(P)H dehydrogenase (quinone)
MPLLHLGLIIVSVPYSKADMIHTEVRGATPYGAPTIAGAQGELQPTAEDLSITRVEGKRVLKANCRINSLREVFRAR